ncbi:MAG: hypothetical protein MJ239_07430 [Bacilli bacterium]|nr:hypothetical protein [Bacilli bacterium]
MKNKNRLAFASVAMVISLLSAGCSSDAPKGNLISFEQAKEIVSGFHDCTGLAKEELINNLKSMTGLFTCEYRNGSFVTENVGAATLQSEDLGRFEYIDDADKKAYLSNDTLTLDYILRPEAIIKTFLETSDMSNEEKSQVEEGLNEMKGNIKAREVYDLSGFPLSISLDGDLNISGTVDGQRCSSDFKGGFTYKYSDYRDIAETAIEESGEEQSNSIDAVSNDDAPLDHWLYYIPGNTPITNINLPGTHDGTTGFMNSMAGLGFPKTQDHYLPWAFDHGVRYIDMRLVYTSWKSGGVYDKLGFGHGNSSANCFYSYNSGRGATLGRVDDRTSFNDVVRMGDEFLRNQSSEFLVYQMKGECTIEDSKKHGGKTWTTSWMEEQARAEAQRLASSNPNRFMYIDHIDSNTDVYTLEQVRGKIIFSINVDSSREHSMYGSQSAVCDVYDEGYNRKIDDLRDTFNNSTYDISTAPCKFWNYNESSANYNPRIVHCSCYRSPSRGALNPRSCSSHVNDWVDGYSFSKGKKYGWVLFDYCEEYLCRKIINTNPSI